MEEGTLTCSQPTNEVISSQDSSDTDDLDNFVLQIDDIDMTNTDNSDSESNDDRFDDNELAESNLKDTNRTDSTFKDSRFSNHDRLKPESKQSGLDNKQPSEQNNMEYCEAKEVTLKNTCKALASTNHVISENKENIPQKIQNELSGSKIILTIKEDVNDLSEYKDDEFESVDKELNSLLTSEEDGGTDSKTNETDVSLKDKSVASENNTTHNLLKESLPSSANNVSQEETSVNPSSTEFNNELKKSNDLLEEAYQNDSKNNKSVSLSKEIVTNDSENSITAVTEKNQVGHNGEIEAMDHEDSQGNRDLSQNTDATSLKRLAERDDGIANCIKKPKIKDPDDEISMQTKTVNGFGLKKGKPDVTIDDEVDVKKCKDITHVTIKEETLNVITQFESNVGKPIKEETMNVITQFESNVGKPNNTPTTDFKDARERLMDTYRRGEKIYHLDREELDALVMLKVVEYLNNTSDVGELRNKLKFAVSEQMRQAKLLNALKKQIEDARIIIRKLIEEKNSKKQWTNYAVPLKVTRSVGLQVCTCGTVNMFNSKSKDKESVRQLLHLDKNGETSNLEEKKDSEKKEKESSDDVVIVKELTPAPTKSVANSVKQDATRTISPLTRNATEQQVSALDKVRTKTISSPKNVVNSSPAGASSEHVFAKPSLVPGTNKKRLSGEVFQNNTNAQNQKNVIVEATIDLTENEDSPAEASTSQSAPLASPGARVAVQGSLKSPSPVPESSVVKTSPATTSQTSRKSTTMTPNMLKRNSTIPPIGADLYTSYEKLPKFPSSPNYPANIVRPPRPLLRIGKHTAGKQGIMLSWNFEAGKKPTNIEEYQLYAFQESKDGVRDKCVDMWKKVGDIKALPLPMACFLTQFVEGHKYHFVVRAVDKEKILGEFSLPGSIILHPAPPEEEDASTSQAQ